MRLFDLHTHTTSSDGLLTPDELINKSITIGLSGIGITDHDSTDALKTADMISRTKKNFRIIPGIELSCDLNSEEVHILGYFIDYENHSLKNYISVLRGARWSRGVKILQKLIDLGLNLPLGSILEASKENNFIGRATIARYLISFGYVESINEAFDMYLDAGRPAYVERYKLKVSEAINLIHSVGGLSVLAHPGLLKNKDAVTLCIQKGIMGIECRHTKHTPKDIEYFSKICHDNQLISTGGSDYHGDEEILGTITSDVDLIPRFKERL